MADSVCALNIIWKGKKLLDMAFQLSAVPEVPVSVMFLFLVFLDDLQVEARGET